MDDTDDTDDGAAVDQAPPSPAPRIRPAEAFGGDALAVVWDPVEDPDGDTVEYILRWSTDDPQAEFQARSQTVPGAEVRRGFTWTVSVIARAGGKDSEPGTASVLVQNRLPTAVDLAVTPTSPRAGSTLRGTVTTDDGDGDRLTTTWTWTVNGTTALSGVGENVFLGTALKRGDEVVASVEVDDGHGGIAQASSAAIVVENTPPTAPRVVLTPPAPGDDDDLVCSIVVPSTDVDGDTVTYTYRWEKDRVAAGSTAATSALSDTVGAGRTSNGELWACTVTPSDGVDDGARVGAAAVVGATPPDVATMSLGTSFSCAARADGHTVCWGDDLNGRASSPQVGDLYLALASGTDFTCGLRPDLSLGCWGYGGGLLGTQTVPPEGTFVAFDVDGGHGCALASDFSLDCWGDTTAGGSNPPGGTTWRGVAVGTAHGCAIGDDNTVTCWGRDTKGQATPPSDTVALLRAGGDSSCAIRTDRSVSCWGDDSFGQLTTPPGEYRDLAVGRTNVCAIRQSDDALVCWGDDSLGQSSPPPGAFDRVWLGTFHACAQDLAGAVVCWGDGIGGATVLPVGVAEDVSAGAAHECLVDDLGLATCYGVDLTGAPIASAPYGDFVQIDSSGDFGCGVEVDGDVVCWGNDADGQASPPAGDFVKVSVGAAHACAIRTNKEVACWGVNTAGSTAPPAGIRVDDLDAGGSHTCAVKTDGAVDCWGLNLFGQAGAPQQGTFSAVTAGGNHSCAISAVDDTVDCWGFNTFGQARDQAEAFHAVSAGEFHTCGVKSTGALKCWGQAFGGLLRGPDEAMFRDVSAGTASSCAIDVDGGVWCWGAVRRRPLDH